MSVGTFFNVRVIFFAVFSLFDILKRFIKLFWFLKDS